LRSRGLGRTMYFGVIFLIWKTMRAKEARNLYNFLRLCRNKWKVSELLLTSDHHDFSNVDGPPIYIQYDVSICRAWFSYFFLKKHVYLKLISRLNANASVFKIILKIHDVVIFFILLVGDIRICSSYDFVNFEIYRPNFLDVFIDIECTIKNHQNL
jgi:hypothetical protein